MSTVGIIVLYNPEDVNVIRNLETLACQVDELCLVDNSNTSHENILRPISNIKYFPLYENRGIASAQNVALKYALEQGFDYVLFSDPDSFIPTDAVERLLYTRENLVNAGYKVGAVGSTAYSEATGMPYHIKDCFVRKIENINVTEVTYTMNSISLIELSLFKKVGLMDESLFIDGVDDEWCWRAAKLTGCGFFLDDKVIIKHNLGRSGGKIGSKTISLASPQRLYYEYRNYLWLRRRDYVPRHWIKYNGWKYVVKMFYYPLFVSPRINNLRNIIKGIKDGFNIENNFAKF